MDQIINYISILGSFTFAISGALIAMRKKFDPFGVFIIAFVTAVGGGTLRDMLLTGKSVFWLEQTSYIYFVLGGTLFAIVFKSKLNYLSKRLLFFDAIGLGLYTITGVQIGLEYHLSGINCIILGTITGAFGGVIRDILVNEVPVIFMKEIYATVAIVGAILYLIMSNLGVQNPVLQIVPVVFIIIVRLVVIYYQVSLPSLYSKEKD
ncbi:MAG: trimeric intracellular cation channel family protein [Prolixibacteraceae bacterium]